MNELLRLPDEVCASAGAIARAIRERDVSAVEVLAAHLALAERSAETLNAIPTLAAEQAMRRAREIDRAVSEGRESGSLLGVPFTVKDVLCTEGIRTTAGSLLFADHVPARDATVVDRLKGAGAIVLGKSNCPEFAMGLHTDNRVFGPTRNPWNLDVTPGGSSGGDAAAVASGCAAFGIGTDYGGSIRWPAHCTGLAALRPTPGLVPSTGVLLHLAPSASPAPSSASLPGRLHAPAPIARSVWDLWEVLKLVAGPDGHDPNAVPVPLRDPATVEITRLRCAWTDGEGTVPVRADLAAAVEQAAAFLSDLGVATVAERPPSLERAAGVFAELWAADGLPELAEAARGREQLLSATARAWLSRTRPATAAEYQRISRRRDQVWADVVAFMERWPILLLPVASLPAFPVDEGGAAGTLSVDGRELEETDVHACCRAISVLGLPAAVVPWGRSREGLPIGVQVVGRPFADHEVVAVAHALESRFGPATRPPMAFLGA